MDVRERGGGIMLGGIGVVLPTILSNYSYNTQDPTN